MSNILVINASGQETRVALIEQGTISEYYLERKNEKGIVGNIYKGKVVRVLPGMQAAVDAPPGEAGPAAETTRQEAVPAEAAAGAQTAEPAEIVELHPDDAIEDEDEGDGDDDDEEELDEADAAHAAAEEALAAEQAQAAQSPGTTAEPVAEASQGQAQRAAEAHPPSGARGLPSDQRPAAREGRRGRRRGGRGR